MDKQKALEIAIGQIERSFGKGSIMKLGSFNGGADLEVIPTGSIGLDLALGVKGLPRGRIIEIFGPESSGKTTLALHLLAETQKLGGVCAFIDTEHALDPSYARKLNIKTDELFFSQPDNAEQALEIADTLIRSGSIDAIILDSVAALVPKAELEGDMGDAHMGLQARLMSQALRKLTSSVSRSKTILVFINQIRSKIGVMFGSPETTTGGNALKFYSSIRLDIRKVGTIKEKEAGKDKEKIIGVQTRVKVLKNKVAPPFRTADFDIFYGKGVSRTGEIVDLGVQLELIQKSGSWYSYNNTKLGQGKEGVKTFLEQNSDIRALLEQKIYEQSHRLDMLQSDLLNDVNQLNGEESVAEKESADSSLETQSLLDSLNKLEEPNSKPKDNKKSA